MDDLIRRQSAIDALSNGALINYQNAGHNNGLVKAIDVIKGLPSAQQWILCSERLPKEGKNVLITDEDGYVVEADYTRYSWEDDPIQWYSDGCHVTPVAWMPLPKPYKGEDNG